LTFRSDLGIIVFQIEVSTKSRKSEKMAWTDEQRTEAIEAYKAADPTSENSMDIVADIAADLEQSVNGVRAILSKDGCYIAKGKSPSKASTGTARVSKADSQTALTAAIEAAGQAPDDTIISKLTGKAAVYFTEIINSVVAGTE
jgi:hypothetical protein